MSSPDLFIICGSAFIAVFALLSLLAVMIRVIMLLFPEKEAETDTAVIAAVAATLESLYPGTRITKLEVIK
jgi:hypothetical protein